MYNAVAGLQAAFFMAIESQMALLTQDGGTVFNAFVAVVCQYGVVRFCCLSSGFCGCLHGVLG